MPRSRSKKNASAGSKGCVGGDTEIPNEKSSATGSGSTLVDKNTQLNAEAPPERRKSRRRRRKSESNNEGSLSERNTSVSNELGNSNNQQLNENVRKALWNSLSATPLSSQYRIPKKRSINDGESDVSGPCDRNIERSSKRQKITVHETAITASESKNSNDLGNRAGSKADEAAVQETPGPPGRTFSKSDSRRHMPELKSRHSPRRSKIKADSLGGATPVQDAVVDTPQMALVKAKIIANLDEKRKLHGRGDNAPKVLDVDTPQMALLKKTIADKNKKTNLYAGAAKAKTPEDFVHTPPVSLIKSKVTPNCVEGRQLSYQHERTNRSNKPSSSIPQTSPALLQSSASSLANVSNVDKAHCDSPVDVHPDMTETTNIHPVPQLTQLFKDYSNVSQTEIADPMDVDIEMVDATNQPKPKQLLIVIDTNVWIGNQSLIEEILEMSLPFSVNPIILIPWMVLQELDHKIHNKSSTTSFRKAAKFIHGLLSAKHPRVKGQKATDAIIGMEFNELMADDSILNCAIQHNRSTHFMAVLVTNDINLLNKALVHNVASFKADEQLLSNLRKLLSDGGAQSHVIMSEEQPKKTDGNNSFAFPSPFGTSPSPLLSLHSNGPNTNQCGNMEFVVMDIDDPMGMDESGNISNVCSKQQSVATDSPRFEVVATSLQQTLTSIIVPKMAEEYGKDGWKIAIKVQPPFTVESGFRCIQAHWIAVFSFMFPSRAKEIVDQLVNIFHQKPDVSDSTEVKSWRLTVSQMAVVFLSLNNNIASKPRVSECLRLLKEYIQSETIG